MVGARPIDSNSGVAEFSFGTIGSGICALVHLVLAEGFFEESLRTAPLSMVVLSRANLDEFRAGTPYRLRLPVGRRRVALAGVGCFNAMHCGCWAGHPKMMGRRDDIHDSYQDCRKVVEKGDGTESMC